MNDVAKEMSCLANQFLDRAMKAEAKLEAVLKAYVKMHEAAMKAEAKLEAVLKAYEKMHEAAIQGHYAHWDHTQQGGRGCPECIRTRKLRDEADRMIEEVRR